MAAVMEWRTRQEVADLMNVSVQTITREIQRGNLQAVRVGKQIRIPDYAIRNYVEKRGRMAHV